MTFRKCAESIVTIVTTVTSEHNQAVVDDDGDDDTVVSSDHTVSHTRGGGDGIWLVVTIAQSEADDTSTTRTVIL